MAVAVLRLLKCTGTSAGTETDVVNAPNFLWDDEVESNPALSPIPAPQTPAGAPSRSMECVLRWELTTLPDTRLEDLRLWGPGQQPDSPVNKLTIYVGLTASPTTPTRSDSSIAVTRQDTNYFGPGTGEYLTITTADSNDYLDASTTKTHHLYLQLDVDYGATQGNMPTQLFMFRYSEL